jgi:hypothetical protein
MEYVCTESLALIYSKTTHGDCSFRESSAQILPSIYRTAENMTLVYTPATSNE